jgi:hypothetical protein
MKKIVLFITAVFLGVASSGVMAEWERVYSNDKVVTYADTATIRRKGNIVRLWSLFDFKADNTYSDGSVYVSIMRETEFNCKDNLQRMVAFSIHSGKMGKGRMVDSGTTPQDWKPVSKANIAQDMKTFACDRE